MSSARLILRYMRERYPLRVWGPVGIGLTGAGAAAVGISVPAGVGGLGVSLGLCLLMVLGFRLWDDIEDRENDRALHPPRLLPQCQNLRPFFWLLGMLATVVVSLVMVHPGAARSSPELCVKVRGSSSMLRLGCLGDLLGLEE